MGEKIRHKKAPPGGSIVHTVALINKDRVGRTLAEHH
jgi:hypothetical protein